MSIPARNIWWLMLYASDRGKAPTLSNLSAEDRPDDIPDLVAEILAKAVEQRQRRLLTAAFLPREAALNRVRGRIDHLTTSPRNRYGRAALASVSRLVQKPELAHRCRGLAHGLRLQGVVGETPTREQISSERFGRHNQADQPMLAAARLAMDLALPTEEPQTGCGTLASEPQPAATSSKHGDEGGYESAWGESRPPLSRQHSRLPGIQARRHRCRATS